MILLRHHAEEAPSTQEEILSNLSRFVFPLLDFKGWVSWVVSTIPYGKVSTFGSVASALGSIKASRAVGAWAAEGHPGCHRLVYSDGEVPESSVVLLQSEMELEEKGGRYLVPEKSMIKDLKMDAAPFISLRKLQVRHSDLINEGSESFHRMAGVDISSGKGVHVCAVSSFGRDGRPVGETYYKGEPGIPYVSGFLFFREAPLILPAIGKAIENGMIDDNTLLVIDGNGYLHPGRMGIARHIGAVSGMMTCGVAKKLQTGRTGEWREFSEGEEIADVRESAELIGYASRRKEGSPIYISRGNRTTLDGIIKVLIDSKKGRLPVTIRSAHNAANRIRRSKAPSGDL